MDGIRIGDILHQALRAVARYPLLVILVQAITHIDVILKILSELSGIHWPADSETPTAAAVRKIAEGVVGILPLFVAPISWSITCHVVSQTMQGKAPRMRDAVQSAPRHYVSVLGVMLAVILRVALGCLLLIVPGIILAIAAAAAIPAGVVEGLAPFESVRRSTLLTNGNRMKIFYLFLLPVLGGGALIGLAPGALGEGTVPALANLVIRSTVEAYFAVLTVVLYCHLKALKEGLDVPQLAPRASDPESRRPRNPEAGERIGR
jgi:hypothetical protein